MQTPKVSIVMPVFNGEKYLREAATSILNQTFTDIELVIINDGSTDNTESILDEIAVDQRVRVLSNGKNIGLTLTRNKGLRKSKGEYVAMLDSDDIALPNRIEKQLAFLETNRDFALIGSSIDLINSSGKYIRTQHYPTPSAYIPSLLFFQNNFAQSAVMIRKSALPDQCYREEYPQGEDYDLWIRISGVHKTANINSVLVKYRMHDESVSNHKAAIHQSSVKSILTKQLQQIGIEPTTGEIQLHMQLGVLEVPKTKEAILAVESWLLKVSSANAKSRKYPSDLFNTIVSQKWYEVCQSSRLGSWSYKKMISSPLFDASLVKYMLLTRLKPKLVT